jgi:trigger factor
VKSVVETLNPTRVKLAVEVPFSDLEPNIKSAYQKISGQVTVPGFRKGKVPPAIIDQRFGRAAILQDAVNDAMPQLYSDAVRESEIRPLGQPDVEITEFGDGEDLKFTAEVDVRPEITLPEWEGLEVEVEPLVVTDEDVDTHLEALRSRFATLVGVERAAADGDYVMIDIDAKQDGEPVEGGQATQVSYQIGSGQLQLDGIDEAVTGLSAGESTTFKTTLVGSHDGMDVDCEVTVTAVKEQELPELDAEFAEIASEFDTLDELRESLRQSAERSKRLEQAVSARDKVLDALLEQAGDVPLPAELISSQIEEHFDDGHGDDEHRTEFEDDLRKNLKAQFVLDELVKAENVEVGQEELTSYIISQAQQSGVDPNRLAQQFVNSGNLPALMSDVARGKALAMLVEKAKVTDTNGEVIDLENLQEDGTLGEEAVDAEPSIAPGFEFAELDDETGSDSVAEDSGTDAGEAEAPIGPGFEFAELDDKAGADTGETTPSEVSGADESGNADRA